MCSPPANRKVVATSALRQHGLVTVSRLNSSLTFAVIAIGAILPLVCNSRACHRSWISAAPVAVCRGKPKGVVLTLAPVVSHARQNQLCPQGRGNTPEQGRGTDEAGSSEDHGQAK